MGLFKKKIKEKLTVEEREQAKEQLRKIVNPFEQTGYWYEEQLKNECEKYKRMSNGLQNGYAEELLQRKIESTVSNILSRGEKTLEIRANIKLVTGMIKAFKLDYGTGEEVLNLFKSSDENNEKIATTMLFAAMRNNLKQEIINEINKK